MADTPPVSQLTSHLGFWLRLVSNHVSHAFARKLQGASVTVAEWALLRELYGERRVGPSRLAVRMGMTRGAISKLAERLIAKGLIERQDRRDDARAHWLALTPAGHALVPRLAALADLNDAEFFEHLTSAERASLEGILRAIAERHGLEAIPVA